MNRVKKLDSLLLLIAAIIALEIAASARLATNVGKLTLGVLVNYDYQSDRWKVALETPDW